MTSGSTTDDDDLAMHLLALLSTSFRFVDLERSSVGSGNRSHVAIVIEVEGGGRV